MFPIKMLDTKSKFRQEQKSIILAGYFAHNFLACIFSQLFNRSEIGNQYLFLDVNYLMGSYLYFLEILGQNSQVLNQNMQKSFF